MGAVGTSACLSSGYLLGVSLLRVTAVIDCKEIICVSCSFVGVFCLALFGFYLQGLFLCCFSLISYSFLNVLVLVWLQV